MRELERVGLVSTPDVDSPEMRKRLLQMARETDRQLASFRQMRSADTRDYESWKVTVPPYDADGVVIERFEVTYEEANTSKLRAALNPQRGDRSVEAGMYTRLLVDGVLWMSDTPTEVRDHDYIDDAMTEVWAYDSEMPSMLIVGLGLGLVLRRVIMTYEIPEIDVVERDSRVIAAVGEHYQELAAQHEVSLRIHQADINDWRPPRSACWDLGFFDIWANIDMADLPEVARLRRRFRPRLSRFEAWAQKERIAQKRRIKSGKWLY